MRTLAAILVLAALGACKGRDDLDGTRRPIAGLDQRGEQYAAPELDGKVHYDLYDNRAAAVVHVDGALVIDAGSAELAKYVEGNYRSPWHLARSDGGRRAALFAGLAGELYLPIDADAGGVRRDQDGSVRIELYARAAEPRQLVSVFLNERRLGDISMPTTAWERYSINAPAAAVLEGENKLRFYFRHSGTIDGQTTAAALARIRVGAGGGREGGEAPLQARAITRDGLRQRALHVPAAARLSYYVWLPPDAPELVMSVAGEDARLAVRVAREGAEAEIVWEQDATPAWRDVRVPLGAFAGEVVRLDLWSDGAADWGRPRLARAAAPEAPVQEPEAADHVIVWVVSSLRADRVGGRAVPTPALSRLAARGLVFERAHSPAPAPGPAHAAILTGTFPDGGRVPEGARTLGERFREAGYATALISGNGFISDEAGFSRGFDLYDNPMRRRHPFGAAVLWQRARRFLAQHKDGRTLIYMATVEPHLPYTPSAESLAAEWARGAMRFSPAQTATVSESMAAGRERLSADERAYVEALYDATVRDADAAFAAMLADLEQLGVADRTAIILVGDHGQELFERGGFGHGRHLHEEVLAVPLVIAPAGSARSGTVEHRVGLVDLYATALDLAGIAVNPESQGTGVLPWSAEGAPRRPHPVFSHLPGRARALAIGRYKLIVPLRGPHELYDLQDDPEERENLMGRRPIAERALRNVFGIGVTYERSWSRQRWGREDNVTSAFAADHGL